MKAQSLLFHVLQLTQVIPISFTIGLPQSPTVSAYDELWRGCGTRINVCITIKTRKLGDYQRQTLSPIKELA